MIIRAADLPNPLFDAWRESNGVIGAADENQRCYAWAIPSPEALETLAALAPIVEIGAGGGYWAHLLRELGVDIVCYDQAPPSLGFNGYARRAFTHVQVGSPCSLMDHHQCTLFLCWPPMSKMARDAVQFFEGRRVVYVGEPYGGMTADDEFFDILEREFVERSRIAIPQWRGHDDAMYIYERKDT